MGLEGYGLEVEERVAIVPTATEENSGYLDTKREKLGHCSSPEWLNLRGNPTGSGRRRGCRREQIQRDHHDALSSMAPRRARRHGTPFDDIDVIWVPGAWELPLASRARWRPRRYEAVVALGAVIRGDTPHFDYVAGEASRGLSEASRDSDFRSDSVFLRATRIEQALERARAASTATRDGTLRSRHSRWPTCWIDSTDR